MAIALTFDDGPDPRGTRAVLNALGRAGARATFFVVGPLAERHPDLVRRILGDGHTVGLHCDEHVRHTERDRAWVAADTSRALARLRRLEVTPRLWRTPWGVRAAWTAEIAQRHDLSLVNWTVDTHDWRGDGAAAMFAATRDQLRDGALVLAHDGIGPGARRDDVAETAAYVELVGRHAATHKLRLGSL
jgi:peptidoglycan/xylan/chitin deacetylase (PgdA/CDA1 family)